MFRRDKWGGVRSEQILNSFTCSLAVRSLLRRCGWPRGMALLESSCSRTQWTTAMGTMPRCTQTTGGCPTPAPREGPPLWVKAIPSPQATPLQVGLLRKSLLESEVFQNTRIACWLQQITDDFPLHKILRRSLINSLFCKVSTSWWPKSTPEDVSL